MKISSSFSVLMLATAFSFSARGQSARYDIKGRVFDSARHDPLVSATVYVSDPGDSAVITLGFTDDRGAFVLKGIPRDKELVLMIFYTGYEHYRRKLAGVKKDLLDMGNIDLSMNAHALNAVIITGEKPPIVIRGDTIEFNASSFKTRPNSVLAALLKKLPGVEVDRAGSITANGKTVDRILVNGEKFFGDDPKIALQNLPAAIVDQVQVTDTKTREEALAGRPSGGDTKTINITLKEGKDHGIFGRAYAGYGTGKHYDASALLNYFEGKRQISLLGATNNIDQVGFTMNEMMNVMGGWGRGVHSVYKSDDGSFGLNGITFGPSGTGLNKTTLGGINYNDAYGKHFSVNGSYFYGDVSLDDETKTARQNILPDSVFYYRADNIAHHDNLDHRIAATINYKDSLLQIFYEPYIGISRRKGISRNNAVSTGEKGYKINQGNSMYATNERQRIFRNSLDLYRSFKQKGRYLYFSLTTDNRAADGENYNNYRNIFYDGNPTGDSVDQYIDNQAANADYRASLSYNQPFSKVVSMNIRYRLHWQYALTDKETFDYDDATGKYTIPDTVYSNKFRGSVITQTPQLGFTIRIDSGKWRLDANADFNFIGLHHYSFTHSTAFDRNRFFVSPDITLTHQVTGSGSLRLGYDTDIRQPDIAQLLPVADNTNSLYRVIGNPDLKPAVTKNIRLVYSSFDFESGNNIWLNIRYSNTKDDISRVAAYDDHLRQLATYTNVNGNSSYDMNLDVSKTRKKENYHWQVKLSAYAGLDHNRAFINGTSYTARNRHVSFHPSVTYGYKELFEITPSYNFYYQYSRYDIKALDDRQNTMYEAGFSGTLYWPAGITWASDWRYTHNSDVTPGFQKGYWLWNASVGIDLFKKKQAALELSAYDLLDQHVSVHRSITDTYTADTQTIVLHRYFMLKFIYNLRKFGKKQKKKNRGPVFFF